MEEEEKEHDNSMDITMVSISESVSDFPGGSDQGDVEHDNDVVVVSKKPIDRLGLKEEEIENWKIRVGQESQQTGSEKRDLIMCEEIQQHCPSSFRGPNVSRSVSTEPLLPASPLSAPPPPPSASLRPASLSLKSPYPDSSPQTQCSRTAGFRSGWYPANSYRSFMND